MTEITTQGMNSLAERIVTTVMPLLQGSWKPLLQRIAKYMVSACSQKEQENMHQILLRVRTWQLICLDKSFLVLISQRTVDVQQYFESLHRDLDDWQKKTQVPIGSGPLVNSEILRKQIWNQWDSLELQWPNDYKEKENAIKDAIAAFLTPNERIPLLINLICDYAKNEQGTLIQAAFDRILDSKGDICRQYYNSLGPVDDGASVPKLDSNAQKEDFPAAMVIPSLADITIVNSLGPSFGYGFQAQWRGMPVLLRMLFGQPNTNEETCANVFQKLLTKQYLLEEKNQTPRSPYIETLLGVLATKDHLAFATDCTDDLFELISRARLNPDSLRWSKRLQIAWQISHAMRYLHEELKVFHSDLRSGTIMLDEDSNVRVGAWMSQAFHSKVQWLNPQLLQRLPPVASKDKVAWKAPEIVQTHAFTQACNVYAFGIILWELMTLEIPWAHSYGHEIIQFVRDSKRPAIDQKLEHYSGWINLIEQCWHQDPKIRPTFKEIQKRLALWMEPDTKKEEEPISAASSSMPLKNFGPSDLAYNPAKDKMYVVGASDQKTHVISISNFSSPQRQIRERNPILALGATVSLLGGKVVFTDVVHKCVIAKTAQYNRGSPCGPQELGLVMCSRVQSAPCGLAFDEATQRLYASFSQDHCIQIYQMPQFELIEEFGGQGHGPSDLLYPAGITIAHKRLYVVDSGNHRVQAYTLAGVWMYSIDVPNLLVSNASKIVVQDHIMVVSNPPHQIFVLYITGRLITVYQPAPTWSGLAIANNRIWVTHRTTASLASFPLPSRVVYK